MASEKLQPAVFMMKKEPSQVRSRASVEAMVEACARILEERGYAGLTTNAVAEVSGVSIGSLYEYFPGKEAIVARLAEAMVAETVSLLRHRLALTDNRNDLREAMRHFLGALYGLMCRHRRLLRVLVFQVPYLHRLPATRELQRELQSVLQDGLHKTREQYDIGVSPTTLYLMSTSAAGTLIHLVLMTPEGLHQELALDGLVDKLADWLMSG